jgi:hypothetical protein
MSRIVLVITVFVSLFIAGCEDSKPSSTTAGEDVKAAVAPPVAKPEGPRSKAVAPVTKSPSIKPVD